MIHVEDYIGGFLLKNHYCTFPSLGTLNLKKGSSSYDGDQLDAPEYKIDFSPVGIIDDAFPTYIADHENVSIAKASNEIRNFSQKVKTSLQKSGRFEVDLVGSFLLKDETVVFKQSSDLNLGYEHVKVNEITEVSDTTESEEKRNDGNFKNLEYTHADSAVSKPKSSVLIKYLIGLLLLVGLAAGAYFAYNYFKGQGNNSMDNEEASIVTEPEDVVLAENDTTYNGDEALVENDNGDAQNVASAATDAPNTVAPAVQGNEVNIAIQSFQDKNIAESKSKKLNTYGNKTSVMTIDGKIWLVITAAHPTNDLIALKDSVRRFFNPSGTPFVVK